MNTLRAGCHIRRALGQGVANCLGPTPWRSSTPSVRASSRHARSCRHSATAKLILAEILLRSLDFEGAPAFPGERWRQRVQRAEALIAEARMHSVDWQRLAPVLVWLARAHESGQGGLSIDPTLTMGYRQLAASAGTAELKDLVVELEAQTWLPVPPSDDLRFEMPVEDLRCE